MWISPCFPPEPCACRERPQGWTTRAIRLDGVDVFGLPLELTPGAHELEVVISDHLASASGVVTDRRGAPLGGFDVVLFPQAVSRAEGPDAGLR